MRSPVSGPSKRPLIGYAPDQHRAMLAWDGLELDLPEFEGGDTRESLGAPSGGPASPLGGLVWRPMIYSRNSVSWLSVRAWASDSKKMDLARFRQAKAAVEPAMIQAAGTEVARILSLAIGGAAALITAIPCGHSRRPDCFGKQLAQAVAKNLGVPFECCWADRFLSGSSHPRQFDRLEPLEWTYQPGPGLIVLVDDVATSGLHMEEALTALRGRGNAAIGVVWISGTLKK